MIRKLLATGPQREHLYDIEELEHLGEDSEAIGEFTDTQSVDGVSAANSFSCQPQQTTCTCPPPFACSSILIAAATRGHHL